MDLVLLGIVIALQIFTIVRLWHARGLPPVLLRTDEDAAPAWGTPARKLWHAEQRDYHAAKVVQAGLAYRDGGS